MYPTIALSKQRRSHRKYEGGSSLAPLLYSQPVDVLAHAHTVAGALSETGCKRCASAGRSLAWTPSSSAAT